MGYEVQCGVTFVNGLPKHGNKKMLKDIRGERFGRLVVEEFAYQKKTEHNTASYWVCKCDCGNIITTSSNSLKSGSTKSCGCIRKEKSSVHCKSMTTIRYHNERLYAVWRTMRSRCLNPNRPEYKNYGGRGIKVCDEWKNNFSSFYEWALANGYDKNAKRSDCTLDRIDVNGNYEPSNCRWVDMFTQAQNKRRNYKEKT